MMNDGISAPKPYLACLTTMYLFPLLYNPPEIVRANKRAKQKKGWGIGGVREKSLTYPLDHDVSWNLPPELLPSLAVCGRY